MDANKNLKYTSEVLTIPTVFIIIIWFIYWVEIYFGYNFNKLGIFPRDFIGLRGVFLTHFIHSDTNHLFNNSIPLFVLTSTLFYFYRAVAYKVLFYGAFLTGFLTWGIARDSYHIGASGVVYLLFSFIFFSGIIRKYYRLVAVSLIVIFLYGSMIWYILPIKEQISWEGHLSGFLIGLVFALLYKKQGIVEESFIFSKTDFDSFFDESGNLIESKNIDEDIET